MKILNLYAGIGGNRKLWGEEHEVTAVENNKEIAKIYQNFFPGDKIIITDAHKFLLEHHKKFDFIWSSPPCQTHSNIRKITHHQNKPIYPDMNLYQEILFLKYYFKGKWVVENVIPFYTPLIKPQFCGRHCFWANFIITKKYFQSTKHESSIASKIAKRKGVDCNFKISNKVQIIRNCVNPELGLHVFNMAFKEKQEVLS